MFKSFFRSISSLWKPKVIPKHKNCHTETLEALLADVKSAIAANKPAQVTIKALPVNSAVLLAEFKLLAELIVTPPNSGNKYYESLPAWLMAEPAKCFFDDWFVNDRNQLITHSEFLESLHEYLSAMLVALDEEHNARFLIYYTTKPRRLFLAAQAVVKQLI